MDGLYLKLLRIYSKTIHFWEILTCSIEKQNTTIYMLHGVGENIESPFNISLNSFENFLKYLTTKSVVSTDDLTKTKGECYCLTFDDVRESVFTNAYPLLLKYNIPFTLFVATGLLNKDGYITDNQLSQMSKNALCTVGSHGVSHCMYRFNFELLSKELEESKSYLTNKLDCTVSSFAFPYGSVYACSTNNVKELSNSSIYERAFSTIATSFDRRKAKHQYFMPRINLTNDIIERMYKHD